MLEQINQVVNLRRAERFDEARNILTELLEAYPGHARVHYEFACFYDGQGLEHDAIPHYEKAIANGLQGDELRSALLGLGSSYRCVGAYQQAVETLERGITLFPEAGEFPTFLAMALYNLGKSSEAVGMLLKTLVQTSRDDGVIRYRKALLYYHDKLDETW
jgi:tetratricopeptide (TPR) repeat protein